MVVVMVVLMMTGIGQSANLKVARVTRTAEINAPGLPLIRLVWGSGGARGVPDARRLTKLISRNDEAFDLPKLELPPRARFNHLLTSPAKRREPGVNSEVIRQKDDGLKRRVKRVGEMSEIARHRTIQINRNLSPHHGWLLDCKRSRGWIIAQIMPNMQCSPYHLAPLWHKPPRKSECQWTHENEWRGG